MKVKVKIYRYREYSGWFWETKTNKYSKSGYAFTLWGAKLAVKKATNQVKFIACGRTGEWDVITYEL